MPTSFFCSCLMKCPGGPGEGWREEGEGSGGGGGRAEGGGGRKYSQEDFFHPSHRPQSLPRSGSIQESLMTAPLHTMGDTQAILAVHHYSAASFGKRSKGGGGEEERRGEMRVERWVYLFNLSPLPHPPSHFLLPSPLDYNSRIHRQCIHIPIIPTCQRLISNRPTTTKSLT